MKVFVLFTEQVFDFDDAHEIEVFSTEEKAMEKFNEFVRREKKNAENDGWEVELDEKSFSAYAPFSYAENRMCAEVTELEVI